MQKNGIKRIVKPVSLATVMVTLIGSPVLAKDISTDKKEVEARDGDTESSKANEHILVRGKKTSNILTHDTGVDLMPQDVMHTPQNINVVPQKILQEQNIKSLDEALKNVPGVTSSVGEGRGGMSGNQFLIRGFQAQNDIYEDGLRDFGVYSRDSFNYDSVVVIKGPSSSVFGNGTTGGAINVITKKPMLTDRYDVNFTGGNGDYYRGTIDLNKEINDHIAVRLTAVGNSNNVVGRDYIYSKRWGLAPSALFKFNDKINYVVQFMHQQDDRMPDYGIPTLIKPGNSIAKPMTKYGVRRSNWYGRKEIDRDQTQDNQLTGRLTYDVNPDIVIHNDTRYGNYSRYFAVTRPRCNGRPTCSGLFFSNNPGAAMMNTDGPSPYNQDTWSFQNVLSTVANFETWKFKHQLTAGVDVVYASERREYGEFSETFPDNNVLNPSPYLPTNIVVLPGNPHNTSISGATGAGDPASRKGNTRDVGVFIYDQIWFTEQWSIKGGVRYDNWRAKYNTEGGSSFTANNMKTNNNVVNPTASLMFNPDDNQMYYFTWALSTTPLGMYLTNSYAPMQDGEGGMKPERSRLYELGGKWSLMDKRLGLTASLFRLEKNNQLVSDPLDGSVVSSGDQVYNEGIELGISGNITKHWDVYGGFAAYHSKVTDSQTKGMKGSRVQYVPTQQGSLWTTYEILPNTPYNLQVGGGITWRGDVWLSYVNTRQAPRGKAPANMSIDAMLSHKFDEHWKVAFNMYNVTNRLNYDSLFSNRVTPSAGRAFLFSLNMTQ
ncbi:MULTISPECIES: TonB-dependent receptor [Commensalibacter]|uniref:TonB-dependent outer membrane siderophore receptor n=2 Tax=Commensalibacter TaxID=1079922 RepID=W7DXK5_9PROT|nr:MULTISPECIES: TonB-dependent receptor [Commensalibacter]EUK18943.1 TonB-dependent outer membrane siderophore receptor [Commensalibacter papalotli (ex Servin-Garciduenas et al. 2014)]CAI3925339.1 Outer membrane receptor for monomeric catechols (Fiu) [Commensalibacter papalotli (ex Botero et al. 2024)]CAI3926727.1 Outer membrane receptor for monomeric catechols (Fiu) [Commensalibacter papalotli (ex Botero et al. 2024)]